MSLIASPLELFDRLAALIPPPRTHRHRYFGCFAPKCPLRAAPMCIIAFVTDPIPVKAILSHLNLPTTAPPVSSARGRPQTYDTPMAPPPHNNPPPPLDQNAQPAPDIQFDQRIPW